ncbi:thiamine phosphate synthase [Snodgrassella sp. B3882]|uniref:thiamine phosphate synthase n=1 Tax=Snodgrassella sp. B3882 TaxID=2818037 RepID=UPI00226ADC14|nr:thiamine phosphate synthase [Snodgrassella sp. B3882]MCX8744058.1 thiamine phosphate synthase [Snodgrassella sp. B3882]
MQKQLDLTLYLVLDPVLCGGIAGMVQTTQLAVANGVTAVQLRSEQAYDRRDWYQAALALKEVLAETTVPLLINDQVDVAMAVQADGVHVGQSDLPVDVVRKLIGTEKLIGLSVSNASQMQSVPWEQVDYLGIGPIYPTNSKSDAAPVLGVEQLQKLVQSKQCPAVAIGGINRSNITQVMQTGVDGVAVISAICAQPDVGAATQQLLQQIRQAQS